MKNRLSEIKRAQKKCFTNKIHCSASLWNTLHKMIHHYSFEIKPEVVLLYGDKIHTFTPANANRVVAYDINRSLPIHYAAEKGDVGDIKTVLSWGADVNSKNKYDETPLTKATQSGNLHAVTYLLQNGALITQSRRPFEDFNPFHYALLLPKKTGAANSRVLKTLHALVNSDPERLYLNKSSRKGTPLEIAISEKLDPSIINFLLLHGAEISRKAKRDAAKLNEQYEHVKKKILED